MKVSRRKKHSVYKKDLWDVTNRRKTDLVIKNEASEKGESKRIAVKCNTKLCDPPEKARPKIPKESEWEYTGGDKE